MTKPALHCLGIAPLRDSLVTTYQQASNAFAATLLFGTAIEILTSYRATLVAEVALLRSCGGVAESVIASAVEYEIAQVDRDIAERAGHKPN